MKNVNLRNIFIKITENRVDWNICREKTEQTTHVFDTTTTQANRRPRLDVRELESSDARARSSIFTSGSRPSSSRRQS